ncbi:MAG: hypothetical protein KJP21_02550, partial [Bacteroidia bacterium]|nr:hypothetical protein [Bacteroidia bacterium]
MSISINPYLRKTLYIVSLILLGALFVTLKSNQENHACMSINIAINAPIEKQLITENLVKDKLEEWYTNGLSGVLKKDINLIDVESNIKNLPAVKDAEVSFDLRGELKIEIEQRVPVVRIINSNGASYYLDNEYSKIPSAGTDVARVPIANGNFSEAMIKKVYTLSTYVQENGFMQALTEQIFVNKKGDLIIIPKVRNQTIVIGDTLDIEEKFIKLIDFYKHGLN